MIISWSYGNFSQPISYQLTSFASSYLGGAQRPPIFRFQAFAVRNRPIQEFAVRN